jgi:phosphoglucosamine mutase
MDIELELDKPLQSVHSRHLGKARRMTDAPRRYIEFCKGKVCPDINLSDFRIVVDCAHGATYHIAPKVFEELGAEVITHAIQPDGLNINDQCGATRPHELQKIVREYSADAGIALDGDGDRIIMIDNKGEIVDGDEVLYIIAAAKTALLNGAVVGTVMSNLGLEHAIRKLDLDFMRAQVGDRYIMEILQRDNLMLGGETSGHIISLDMTTTGDGILSGLQVLETMAKTGKTLHELKAGMSKFPQKMINIKVQEKLDFSDLDVLADAVKAAQSELGDSGRILLRPSGTEPLIRVMVEGEDETQVQNLVRSLADEVEAVIRNSL